MQKKYSVVLMQDQVSLKNKLPSVRPSWTFFYHYQHHFKEAVRSWDQMSSREEIVKFFPHQNTIKIALISYNHGHSEGSRLRKSNYHQLVLRKKIWERNKKKHYLTLPDMHNGILWVADHLPAKSWSETRVSPLTFVLPVFFWRYNNTRCNASYIQPYLDAFNKL